MKNNEQLLTPRSNVLKKYLLGNLEEGAKEQLEKILLQSHLLYEKLEVVEEELIQDYVDGKLSQEEIILFENNFILAGDRKEKLKIAQAIRKSRDTLSGS